MCRVATRRVTRLVPSRRLILKAFFASAWYGSGFIAADGPQQHQGAAFDLVAIRERESGPLTRRRDVVGGYEGGVGDALPLHCRRKQGKVEQEGLVLAVE
jgi:hypothetical protein